jgi:hypothetical protein
MKKYIVLGLLLITVSLIKAQYYGEIGGIVSDAKTEEALPFANISLQDGDRIVDQTSSDEFGKYMFSRIPEGVYSIVISYVGYTAGSFENIQINNKELKVYNLELTQGNDLPTVYVFPDIIIETPLIGEEIDLKEIKQIGARDVGSIVVQTTPRVYSQDGGDGDGGIHISGARDNATLYVIDGIRVIGSTYLPKSSIASITVYTGGIPANYGDVTGGIIEITTRSYSGIW